MEALSAWLSQYSAEFSSPLYPFHVGAVLLVIEILVAVIWIFARYSEKRNFTEMLARLSNMTVKLKDAEHFGHFGSFNWDADPKKTFWSEEMFNLFDMVPGQTPPSLEKVISMVLQEDREKAGTAIKRAQEVAGPFSI